MESTQAWLSEMFMQASVILFRFENSLLLAVWWGKWIRLIEKTVHDY